jgi:hypothetical protein
MNDNEILEKLTTLAYDYASKSILGNKQQVLTSFVLLKEDQSSDIIATPWKDDAEKREAVMAIASHIIRSKEPVCAYSMVTECWGSHYQGDEKKRAERPEFDPERHEFVLSVVSTGTEQKFSAWMIERDASGNCAKLIENKESGKFESWMIEALDKAMHLAKFKNEALRNQGNN